MHLQVLRSLRVRDSSIPDQPYCLKLELPRKPPSLHDPPPAPSKHLTRCLWNRVQAKTVFPRGEPSLEPRRSVAEYKKPGAHWRLKKFRPAAPRSAARGVHEIPEQGQIA